MNFIHLLSTEAVQHITIQCLNTPVWAEGPSLQPSDKAVSFRAWTGERIQAGDLLEPLIPRDDCWVWVLIYWWRIDIVKLRHLSPISVSQKPCFYLYLGCKLREELKGLIHLHVRVYPAPQTLVHKMATSTDTFCLSSSLSDERWPLAPDPLHLPDPGPELTPHSGGLQPTDNRARCTLPPGGWTCVLPIDRVQSDCMEDEGQCWWGGW